MRIVPQSHLHGSLDLAINGEVMANAMSGDALLTAGLDPANVIDIVMQPGDVALWNPYLVHGSGPNRSVHKRRFYIKGYVRAAACAGGEWASRPGEPVPLGEEPALVHYEQLRERPEPHYV